MASDGYPARPKDFAERFVRLLATPGVASTLGADACWLLAVIAHAERARGYSAPVTFWNGQLGPAVGAAPESRLIRLREKAISAGWLRYEPGRNGTPPRYWVSIPAGFRDADDGRREGV